MIWKGLYRAAARQAGIVKHVQVDGRWAPTPGEGGGGGGGEQVRTTDQLLSGSDWGKDPGAQWNAVPKVRAAGRVGEKLAFSASKAMLDAQAAGENNDFDEQARRVKDAGNAAAALARTAERIRTTLGDESPEAKDDVEIFRSIADTVRQALRPGGSGGAAMSETEDLQQFFRDFVRRSAERSAKRAKS